MSEDDDRLLTSAQLAELRGVPQSRINKERLTGEGPPYLKDRNLVRYRLGDYRQWLGQQRRYQSTSEATA